MIFIMLQKSSSTFIDVIVTNDILSENKNLECIRMCFLYIVIFGFFFLQQSSVLCLCSLFYHYCFLIIFKLCEFWMEHFQWNCPVSSLIRNISKLGDVLFILDKILPVKFHTHLTPRNLISLEIKQRQSCKWLKRFSHSFWK